MTQGIAKLRIMKHQTHPCVGNVSREKRSLSQERQKKKKGDGANSGVTWFLLSDIPGARCVCVPPYHHLIT